MLTIRASCFFRNDLEGGCVFCWWKGREEDRRKLDTKQIIESAATQPNFSLGEALLLPENYYIKIKDTLHCFIGIVSERMASLQAFLRLALALLIARHHSALAFALRSSLSHPASSRPFLNSARCATPSKRKSWSARERDAILGRDGEYFKLDRMRGKIEFGSSSRIQTSFDGSDEASVRRWLADDEQIAMSIWDPKLIREVEPKVYRLKVMTLMFVTIQLSPHVDVRMWTDEGGSFNLESVAFDPNIQLLPGIGVSADSLGISIDVVGELYPSKDGKGVDGKIGFVTSGELPPPMRLLPEPVLKSSLSTINRTISNFAVSSFQNGARTKFSQFLQSERLVAQRSEE